MIKNEGFRSSQFKNGDLVIDRFATGEAQVGVVIQVYKFEDEYRVIVRFPEGPTGVYFEHELVGAKADR